MTRFAYNTPVGTDGFAAEVEAIRRHSHHYTDAAGWLFRADTVRYSYTVDADREHYGTTAPRIELRAYPVVRWTPKGATLRDIWGGGGTRWTTLGAYCKQYASRTARDAVAQLLERRRRQLWVLSRKIDHAEEDRCLAEMWLETTQKETTT